MYKRQVQGNAASSEENTAISINLAEGAAKMHDPVPRRTAVQFPGRSAPRTLPGSWLSPWCSLQADVYKRQVFSQLYYTISGEELF